MQEYEEDDFLLLSGIQHFNFCRRQWALIHIEQQWQENVLTLEGSYVHEVADNPFIREKRKDKLIVRAMPVHSRQLGITGICDVVEFVHDSDGIEIMGEEGRFRPIPVEYKRGKPKLDDSDRSQLTAQVMCLEEMLACELSQGYLFYNQLEFRTSKSQQISWVKTPQNPHEYWVFGIIKVRSKSTKNGVLSCGTMPQRSKRCSMNTSIRSTPL